MEEKKRVTILVIIALVLAIGAIAFNAMSEEVPTVTQKVAGETQSFGAQVGVTIEAPTVEDKLTGTQQ
jgi:hypothetical protein